MYYVEKLIFFDEDEVFGLWFDLVGLGKERYSVRWREEGEGELDAWRVKEGGGRVEGRE